ncbi:tRNA adenosine(34) deaminase TadA [candidate division KSB1 bacterium]
MIDENSINDDFSYGMRLAFQEAERAFEIDEVPVGAVVLFKNRIIGKGFNQVEQLKDPTAHAEMIAITAAASYLDSKWLYDADLYVTKEPCSMCAGAIVHARIRNLIFGAYDVKAGACGTVLNIAQDPNLNHKVNIVSGIEESKCSSILQTFFQKRRKENKELKRSQD